MLKQLITETRFRIHNGNSNVVSNSDTTLVNTHSLSNINPDHFVSGRLTIPRDTTDDIFLTAELQTYSLVYILADNIIKITYSFKPAVIEKEEEIESSTNDNLIDHVIYPQPMNIITSSITSSTFNYNNPNQKISNIVLSPNIHHDTNIYYLLVNDHFNTIIESL